MLHPEWYFDRSYEGPIGGKSYLNLCGVASNPVFWSKNMALLRTVLRENSSEISALKFICIQQTGSRVAPYQCQVVFAVCGPRLPGRTRHVHIDGEKVDPPTCQDDANCPPLFSSLPPPPSPSPNKHIGHINGRYRHVVSMASNIHVVSHEGHESPSLHCNRF